MSNRHEAISNTITDFGEVAFKSAVFSLPTARIVSETPSPIVGIAGSAVISGTLSAIDHFIGKNAPIHETQISMDRGKLQAEIYRVVEQTKSILTTINPVLSAVIINSPLNPAIKAGLITGLLTANAAILYYVNRNGERIANGGKNKSGKVERIPQEQEIEGSATVRSGSVNTPNLQAEYVAATLAAQRRVNGDMQKRRGCVFGGKITIKS